jgi:mannitol/fructose-specific phosphotransferase system IIA component (Ntr-type)
VSRTGVALPRGSAPAHLIFLLVSPAGDGDGHLHSLAALARLLSEPGRVNELLERYAPETSRDWLHWRE